MKTTLEAGPMDLPVRPGFADWHAGRYAGLQLEIAGAAWDAAIKHCMAVLSDAQMSAGFGKAAVDSGTGEAYYNHDALDTVIECLAACMDEIEAPNAM